MPCSFHKHLCPFCIPVSLQECPSSVSDQWHSVAGHRILLFCCPRSLMLWRMLVLLWCWKGLPSGGWWWETGETAGDWATSYDSVHDVLVNKKSNAISCLSSFHRGKPGVLPLLFRQSSSTSFHGVQGALYRLTIIIDITPSIAWRRKEQRDEAFDDLVSRDKKGHCQSD